MGPRVSGTAPPKAPARSLRARSRCRGRGPGVLQGSCCNRRARRFREASGGSEAGLFGQRRLQVFLEKLAVPTVDLTVNVSEVEVESDPDAPVTVSEYVCGAGFGRGLELLAAPAAAA